MRWHASLQYLGLLCFCLIMASCSSSSIYPYPSTDTEAAETKLKLTSASAQQPVEISIVDELNDGASLHLLVQLRFLQTRSGDDMRLFLSTMQGAEVLETREFPLRSAFPHSIPPGQDSRHEAQSAVQKSLLRKGQVINASLSIPVSSALDYQLELQWGDASSTLTELPLQQPTLDLRKVRVERHRSCDKPASCQLFIKIHGELINQGQKAVEAVVLGIAYPSTDNEPLPGQELDSASNIPQNEQQVPIEGVALKPGEVRPILVKLEEGFAVREGNDPRPRLRILSFRESS